MVSGPSHSRSGFSRRHSAQLRGARGVSRRCERLVLSVRGFPRLRYGARRFLFSASDFHVHARANGGPAARPAATAVVKETLPCRGDHGQSPARLPRGRGSTSYCAPPRPPSYAVRARWLRPRPRDVSRFFRPLTRWREISLPLRGHRLRFGRSPDIDKSSGSLFRLSRPARAMPQPGRDFCSAESKQMIPRSVARHD